MCTLGALCQPPTATLEAIRTPFDVAETKAMASVAKGEVPWHMYVLKSSKCCYWWMLDLANSCWQRAKVSNIPKGANWTLFSNVNLHSKSHESFVGVLPNWVLYPLILLMLFHSAASVDTFLALPIWVYFPQVILPILAGKKTTLPETNVAPDDKPSQKETSNPTIHLQVLC